MADIFISYSSRDRARAEQLADQLQALGYSIWMDVSNIDAATRWGTEIAEAINSCRILILLLSKASIASENVVKELTLAAEKKKHILPVVLEKTDLNPDFEYHLAGLQHAMIENLDAISKALSHFLSLRSLPPTSFSAKHQRDRRKRVVVLPFEDLSSGRDNDWFSDGLTDELTSKLSKLSQVFVIDRLTSRQYKNTRLTLKQIANELQVRFLLAGSVRKAGSRIQVSASLIDTDLEQTLWDDKYPGTMEDIFAIQETIAAKIVDSLKVILTRRQQKDFRERPTENPEAYELGLRAISYSNRNTKQDYLYSIQLCEEAISADPSFVWAYGTMARAYLVIYNAYDRNPDLLDKAERAINRALELRPNDVTALSSLAILQLRREMPEQAIASAMKAIELDPNNEIVYFQLGYVYDGLQNYQKAAEAYAKSLQLSPASLDTHYNLILDYDLLNDHESKKRFSEQALPYFEKYIARYPDDQNKRQKYASLLYFVGRKEDCFHELESLLTLPAIDSRTYYNCACRYAVDGQKERAIELLKRAIDGGFADKKLFINDPDLASLHDTPKWEELVGIMDHHLDHM